MGAEPYEYTVEYQADIQSALDVLRGQVFLSKEFRGAELNPKTPEEALELMEADGTASILDIRKISANPDYFTASPFSDEDHIDLFNSLKPSESMVSDEVFGDIERGECRYIILYENNEPKKIMFVGYSFD